MNVRCMFALLVMTFAACSASEPSAKDMPTRAASPAASPTGQPGSTIAVGHGGGGPPASAQSGAQGKATGSSAGGVSWTAPKGWSEGPERPMRAATYSVPAASGDPEGAECAVFFFGPGQGGGVQANIDRWIGQFEQPDGKPSSERATQRRETINGIPVTTIDLSGTFLGGGPGMGSAAPKKPGYRLLGAIAEAPEGVVFFKMTGPLRTVGAAETDLRSMLKSLKK